MGIRQFEEAEEFYEESRKPMSLDDFTYAEMLAQLAEEEWERAVVKGIVRAL